MTPEQQQEVEDLFDRLLGAGAQERAATLASVTDEAVRREVASLLQYSAPGTALFQVPVADMMRAAGDSGAFVQGFDPGSRAVGARFERYRLGLRLGQGGMGEVFEAFRDNDFHKRVALKIIRRGLDSEPARERFQRERQTLATLEHPGIARLLDGGEAQDGTPYLVLEYVDGMPIDEFCAGRPQAEILALFVCVCAAVDYAHRHLVIHRDLKPLNILVTADGEPKLLDFGIAKLLNADVADTQTHALAMTPQYASPEQVAGQKITTVTDVYSLGVVLYELLTGRLPYRVDAPSASEVERIICEQTPVPPKLGEELDHILLMALRKEPERRYESVQALAADVGRYLRGEAVSAMPDTWRYRVGKYSRRHKFGLAALALVILSLCAGLASTLYQKRRAEQRFQDVRALANTLLFDLHDKIRPLPGSTEARELLVTTSLRYLDKLSADAGNDRPLLLELQTAYARTGDAQGDTTDQSLGNTQAAMVSYNRSLQIGERLRRERNVDLKVLQTLVTVYYRVGGIELLNGRPDDSAATMKKGLAIAQQMQGRSDTAYFQTVRCYLGLAHAQRDEGEPQLAKESTAHALEAEMAGDAAHPNAQTPRALVVIRTQLGQDLTSTGDLVGALEQFKLATQIGAPLLSKEHELQSYDRFQRSLSFAYSGAALVTGGPLDPNLGDIGTSQKYSLKSVELLQAAVANEPKDLTSLRALDEAEGYAAEALGETDKAGALALHRKAVALAAKISADDPKETGKQIEEAAAEYRLGWELARYGDHAGAAPWLRHSLGMQRQLPAGDASSAELQRLLAGTLSALGDADSLAEADKVAEMLWRKHPKDLKALTTLARVKEAQAAAAAAAGRWAEARDGWGRSRDLWRSWPGHGVSSVFDVAQGARAEKMAAELEARLRKGA